MSDTKKQKPQAIVDAVSVSAATSTSTSTFTSTFTTTVSERKEKEEKLFCPDLATVELALKERSDRVKNVEQKQIETWVEWMSMRFKREYNFAPAGNLSYNDPKLTIAIRPAVNRFVAAWYVGSELTVHDMAKVGLIEITDESLNVRLQKAADRYMAAHSTIKICTFASGLDKNSGRVHIGLVFVMVRES